MTKGGSHFKKVNRNAGMLAATMGDASIQNRSNERQRDAAAASKLVALFVFC
jgi:hypothetical protein